MSPALCMARNPKAETRKPKGGRNPKAEVRTGPPLPTSVLCPFGPPENMYRCNHATYLTNVPRETHSTKPTHLTLQPIYPPARHRLPSPKMDGSRSCRLRM